MVRALSVHCKGTGSVPDQGTNIPQATWYGFKKKKKANQMATRLSGTSASRKGRREKQKEGVPGWVQAR